MNGSGRTSKANRGTERRVPGQWVRCAIMHSGYSVVFGRSAGAGEALALHLPELERAALQFLGIQIA